MIIGTSTYYWIINHDPGHPSMNKPNYFKTQLGLVADLPGTAYCLIFIRFSVRMALGFLEDLHKSIPASK